MEINKTRNNFDLIRLIAAIAVVIAHTASRSQYDVLLVVEKILSPKVAVDIFFIVSGFLIFRSFENSSSLTSYIKKRAKRILPAYVAVIVVSAFALYFVSSVSFQEYFGLTWIKYIFFNLITLNFLQSSLPGVFENNDIQAVNTSLWTIKVEIMFYIAVPIIVYILNKTDRFWGIVAIYFLLIAYSTGVMQLSDRLSPELLTQLEQQLPGQLAFFVSGALLYYFYDKFVRNISLLMFVSSFILVLHNYALSVYFLFPISLAIIAIYFCLMFKYLGNFGKHGDFSYGMYIWHFPILQTFLHFQLFDNPWIAIPGVVISVFLASFISWNFIEKPFLNKRSHYVLAETNK